MRFCILLYPIVPAIPFKEWAARKISLIVSMLSADGTKGIQNLKEKKKLHIIAQEASTCAVYGMPRSIVNAGLADQIVPLDQIAQEITMNVGVR